MLSLFFAPGSSSMAPHIALQELGVVFESCPISFANKEQRRAKYLALNPEGKVPLLLIDGRPLTEVAAILFYLASRFPEGKLLPTTLEAQAQAVSWMSFIASTLHPSRRLGIDGIKQAFGIAERRLPAAPSWALGDYSVVDIHLFRLYWRFRNYLQLPPAEFPQLEAHYNRMLARPAVAHTLEIEAALGYELPA